MPVVHIGTHACDQPLAMRSDSVIELLFLASRFLMSQFRAFRRQSEGTIAISTYEQLRCGPF